MTVVHCDYFEDLRQMLLGKLVSSGFSVDPTADVDTLLLLHLNVELRRIHPGPRSVHWSRELRAKEASLPPHLRRAIDGIEKASVKGDDLNPYLSRQLVRDKDANFNDLQFNDWGMKHMHLGEVFEAPGVIKGTKELLFVVVRGDALYFIEVGKHGDWADDRLFTIVEVNWPQLLAHAVLDGVSDGFTPTPEQRARMRKKFVMLTTGAGGKVYGPAGGGSVASGLNLQVRIQADLLLSRIQELQAAHRAQGDEIAAKLVQKTGAPLPELHLKVHSLGLDGEVIVQETQSKILIRSAISVHCVGCQQVAQGTRDTIINAGWKVPDPTTGWECPHCVADRRAAGRISREVV